MNKQLINKYKPEFDHWLNGGSTLLGIRNLVSSTIRWYPSISDPFEEESTSGELLVIINDEYVELRKALAEGKTIQLNEAEKFADSNRGWVDLYCISLDNSTKLFPINYYRIKSDEPKFKVGDFVTPLNREINCSIWQIDNILSCNTLVSGSTMLDPRNIQHWTPVKGEWCWFYDNSDNRHSHLAQFYGIGKDSANSISTFMSRKGLTWYYCEPFLNSLPSYLKDK